MYRGLLAPISWLYAIVVAIRHKLFDWGWLSSKKYDIPIVCVGNITVGGTGKTPMTEALIRHFSTKYKVGVLSRGYGRASKGYHEVLVGSSFRDSGDESKQVKLKFPKVVVSVCVDRQLGIANMRKAHPKLELIILDDGFQHRYVEPWFSIVMVDYNRPVYKDHMLPWGNLRDSVSTLRRAHFIIVSKCPDNLNAVDRRIVYHNFQLYPYHSLFFTRIRSGEPIAIFEEGKQRRVEQGANVILMSGIGNPSSFERGMSKCYSVKKHIIYPDHHVYRVRELKKLVSDLSTYPDDTVVLMTEKDYVKLSKRNKIPKELFSKLYYVPVESEFITGGEEFFTKIDSYVKENPTNGLFY